MWVFFPDAFISVVAHNSMSDRLLARARVKGDLERALGEGLVVQHTPRADYAYRCVVSRERLQGMICARIVDLAYSNFKNEVAPDDPLRHDAYFDVWEAMASLQCAATRGTDRTVRARTEHVCSECGLVESAQTSDRLERQCENCGGSTFFESRS